MVCKPMPMHGYVNGNDECNSFFVFMMVLVAGKMLQCEHLGNKMNMLLHLRLLLDGVAGQSEISKVI